MISQSIWRYRIIEKLSGGAVGVGYNAEDTNHGLFQVICAQSY
jgi:hypothetical protein